MFLKAIIVLFSFLLHTWQRPNNFFSSSLLFMAAFVEIKKAKAAVLIEVRREKRKSSQDLPKRFSMLKEKLPFCGLVEGKKHN